MPIHGHDRSIYALVVWEQASNVTLLFAATPFDLVTVVRTIAQHEHALSDLQYYATVRRVAGERVTLYEAVPDTLPMRQMAPAPGYRGRGYW